MPKGELQNRDRDEVPGLGDIPLSGALGELPPDIANERGDLDTYNTKALGTRFPDMLSAAISRAESKETGLGSPLLDYTVRSIFDSRPTSGFDFNLWFQGEDTETPYTISIFNRCFQVPAGYVAVLRQVKMLVAEPVTQTLNYDGTAKVLIDGTVRDSIDVNTPVFVEQQPILFNSDEPIDTFLIADEGQFIGVDLTLSDWSYDNTTFAILQVGFHGNLLLKTGRPAMFEIANIAGRAKTAVTSKPGEVLSGSELVQKRRRRKPFAHVPILRK